MLAAALVAFGHYLAFFALTAALVLELALISDRISVEVARRIRRADRVAGLAAVLLLAFGFLRVFYFEKGSEYYFANTYFQLKLALFVTAAAISVYPTLQFARWSSELGQGLALDLGPAMARRLKHVIHWELVLIGAILICASLMARGFGA